MNTGIENLAPAQRGRKPDGQQSAGENMRRLVDLERNRSGERSDSSLPQTTELPLLARALGTGPRLTPPIAILGVPFDNVTIAGTIELIERMVASRKPHYLITANVDFLVQAREDIELRRIFLDADLVLCDGTPLLWASRILGNPLPERVAGADLVPLLIRVAAQRKYRIFFLGATAASAAQAVSKLQASYPELTIAGHYSPPFNKLLEMDHDEIKRRILEARPDLLFVCFGCPKQEKWIAMHYRSLGVPVAAGVGGTLDFLAGQLKRAPVWMQRCGTEWVFRLAQEPRRLVRRYIKDLWVFCWCILIQWWQLQLCYSKKRPPQTSVSVRDEVATQCVKLPDRLDLAATRAHAALIGRIVADQRHCLLDLANTRFIDSTGVGLLIHLQNRLRENGRQLVLLSPSRSVIRALSFMHLEHFFCSAPDEVTAIHLIETRTRENGAAVTLPGAAALTPLVWSGEITAANAWEVWEHTSSHLALFVKSATSQAVGLPAATFAAGTKKAGNALQVTPIPRAPDLTIDLSAVRFLDSTGLGLMVKARKLARQQGTHLMFSGLQPAVRNVIRLAQLEEFLLSPEQ